MSTSYTSISSHKLSRLIGTPNAPMHVDVRMDGDVAADPRLVPGETEVDRKWVDDAAALALGSLSRLRERVGERVSPQRDNPQRKEPSPATLGTMLRIARGVSASPASGRGGSKPAT